MAEKKDRENKRKVDLISSHSDIERDNGPLAALHTRGSSSIGPIQHQWSTFLHALYS